MGESTAVDAAPTAAVAAGDSSLRRRKGEESRASSTDDGNGNAAAKAANAKSKKAEPSAEIDGAAAVDYHFKLSSAITVVWFVALSAVMYVVCPSERIERLEGSEVTAATLAAATLAVSCLSTVHRSFSGIIAAALVVQLCAVVTDGLMATAPVPVLIDNVTGARVHMLRWCEFAPLAFLMTLLTEGGDMANNPATGIREGYRLSIMQGASTSFGLIFPFCPGVKSWAFCLCCALSLFIPIFFRLGEKKRRVAKLDPKHKHYRRSVLCLRLLVVEVVVWTCLVVGFLSANVLPVLLPSIPKLQNPAITMIYDCAMDVIAKVIYMALIVNVHDAMFAKIGIVIPAGADQLTLEELRAKELRRQMRKQRRLEKERREAEKAKRKEAEAVKTTSGTASAGGDGKTPENRKDQ